MAKSRVNIAITGTIDSMVVTDSDAGAGLSPGEISESTAKIAGSTEGAAWEYLAWADITSEYSPYPDPDAAAMLVLAVAVLDGSIKPGKRERLTALIELMRTLRPGTLCRAYCASCAAIGRDPMSVGLLGEER